MLLLTKSERAEAVLNKVEICRQQSGAAALDWRQPPSPTHVAALGIDPVISGATSYQVSEIRRVAGGGAGK